MNKSKSNKWISYRRKFLDILLEKYKHLYHGVVLDLGGRDRGTFIKPRDEVEEWIFADINPDFHPDKVLDVANMTEIDSNSIDVINAIELFEHVKEIKKGLKECYRVLKKEGHIIISVPFLYHVHSDPHDYQRWTHTKWKTELEQVGFKIEKFIIMGKFYTHLAETMKIWCKVKIRQRPVRSKILSLFLPFLNLIIKFDNKSTVKNDYVLNQFHNGYFIISRK